MTSAAALLPRNVSTTAYERALAAAMTDPLPTPHRDVVDASRTPELFLPFLAGHESVDLWFDDWTDERKRQMVEEAPALARMKGTVPGIKRFLAFVDAEVVDRVAYPARFVLGRSALGVTPLQHPPFKTRLLVKVTLQRPLNAFVLGRAALGSAALRAVDLEPIRRAKRALKVAKAPESEILVSFAWRRHITFRDGIGFDGERKFGNAIDRKRL